MKILFSFALLLLLIIVILPKRVHTSEIKSILTNSQIIIAQEYAEKFCKAKDDKFFEGLENEKTLKYSYFRYIGSQNKEIFSKEMYKPLISQIKKRCIISNEEEIELNEFLLKES